MEDVKDPFLLKFCGKIGKDFTKCRMKNSFDHIVVIVKESFVDLVDIVKVSFVDIFPLAAKLAKISPNAAWKIGRGLFWHLVLTLGIDATDKSPKTNIISLSLLMLTLKCYMYS